MSGFISSLHDDPILSSLVVVVKKCWDLSSMWLNLTLI